jgi:hypothetical protein
MNVTVSTQDISSYQGDSLTIDAFALDSDAGNAAINLTGATAYFTAKKSQGDTESTAFAHQVSTDSSPLIPFTITALTGKVHVAIPSTVTLSLPLGATTKLAYDIKISLGSGDMHTIKTGTWTVMPSVTTP